MAREEMVQISRKRGRVQRHEKLDLERSGSSRLGRRSRSGPLVSVGAGMYLKSLATRGGDVVDAERVEGLIRVEESWERWERRREVRMEGGREKMARGRRRARTGVEVAIDADVLEMWCVSRLRIVYLGMQ
jgi:hypothetical protein